MTYKEFEQKLNQLAKDLDAKYPNRNILEKQVLEKLKDYFTDILSKKKIYADRDNDSNLMYQMKVDIDQKAESIFTWIDSDACEFVYHFLGDRKMLDIVKPLLDGAAYALADLSERLDDASAKIADLAAKLAEHDKTEKQVKQDTSATATAGDLKA